MGFSSIIAIFSYRDAENPYIFALCPVNICTLLFLCRPKSRWAIAPVHPPPPPSSDNPAQGHLKMTADLGYRAC